MATKKDLVEAYSFSRRRLVTAFVSGAPGGREVEPARPGRTVVGGAALAVLLIAGAAIAGIFSPTVPDDWTEPGRLIVSKETAERYVITDILDSDDEDAPPVLRPVINVTSARLILGSDVEPLIVPQDEIDQQQIGDAIGILDGPANLPSAGNLVPSDWSACTASGRGIRVAFADDSPVSRIDEAGFPVRVGDDYYLIATSASEDDGVPRAYRYRLPGNPGARDNMYSAFQNDVIGEDAVQVSRDWIALFPQGGDLAWGSFGLEGAGSPDPQAGTGGIPADAEVSDLLQVGDERFLLTQDGPVQISAFADAVYSNLPKPNTPRVLTSDELDLGRVAPPYDDNHWPEALPTASPDAGTPCAVLLPQEEGGRPGMVPGVITGGDSEVDPSPVTVPADVSSPRVQAGRGAYVVSADRESAAGGSPFVIDSNGKSYSLLGTEAAELLGYGEVEPRVIPDSWLELFDEGVSLSRDAALCPPTPDEQVSC